MSDRLNPDPAPALAEILTKLEGQECDVEVQGLSIALTPKSGTPVTLQRGVKPGWNQIVVRLPEMDGEANLYGSGWEALGRVIIQVKGRDAKLDVAPTLFLEIAGNGAYASSIEIDGVQSAYATVRDVRIQLKQPCVIRNSASLIDAHIGGEVESVTGGISLEGHVVLEDGSVSAEWASLSAGCIVEGPGKWSFENVQTDDSQRVHFIGGTTDIGSVEGWSAELHKNASLSLTKSGKDISVSGEGILVVDGRWENLSISDVNLSAVGSLSGVWGHVSSLTMSRGASLQGGRALDWGYVPLKVDRIGEAEGAEVSGLDVFSCRIGDLTELRKAERVNIWLPSAKEAVQRASQMDHLSPEQRASFWMMLKSITEQKHSPGALQSAVRFVAAEARRSSTGGRERAILEIYRLVGYGERIGWPLYWFVGASMLAPVFLLTWPLSGVGDWWAVSWRLLLSPLRFFRLEAGIPDIPVPLMPWTSVLSLGVQILGIVMILFSLLATRRLARAD